MPSARRQTATSVVPMLRRPGSLEEMAGISGVGEAKLQRYGEAFLEVLLRGQTR